MRRVNAARMVVMDETGWRVGVEASDHRLGRLPERQPHEAVPREAGGEDQGVADPAPSLTAATGGGGWHLFFAHPGVEVRNTAGRLPGVTEPLPGVDLRGDGGYVVAAPSRHASGGAYRWTGPAAAPPPCPGWLRPAPPRMFPTGGPARVAPERGGSGYGLAALRAELAGVRAAPLGERNNRLNRAAFCLGPVLPSVASGAN